MTESDDRSQATVGFWEKPKVVAEFHSLPPPAYWAAELARLPSGSSVLDLGCGSGRNLLTALGLPLTVHACDRSAAMLRSARRAMPAGRPVSFIQAEMSRLPYVAAFFDCVIASGVFHNACSPQELRSALAETARVLRPGGTLLINIFTDTVEPAGWRRVTSQPLFVDPDGVTMTLLPPGDVLAELAAADLQPIGDVVQSICQVTTGPRALLRGVFRRSGDQRSVLPN